MRTAVLAAAFLLSTAPSFADNMMKGSMSMMKGGEVVAIMPDGHMGTMMMEDGKMMDDMAKMAKPLDRCVMMMTGKDGKVYTVDTSSDAAMKECEKMAK